MKAHRVLVVDDAATIRMYYRDVLEKAGFVVSEAANGYEGLERALAEAFELVIVDVNMPRLDGYAVVEALRCDGPNTATPIVMVSTEQGSHDAARGYAAGANLYFGKPIRPEELRDIAALLCGEPA